EFARLNVTDVVRVCEPTYLKERVESRNVLVHDLPFKDGDVPPPTVLKQWRELVGARVAAARNESADSAEPTTIAVHCVAGLGRAPVLVAVALIEKGMDPLDAIEHVRNKRRGAFNNRQITYLAETYKRASGFKGAVKIGSTIRSSPLNGAQASPTSTATTTTTAGAGTHGDKAAALAAAAAAPGTGAAAPGVHKSFFKKMFGSH
ncbi:hypothetical protein H4R19_002934, partial [Coemansia spiralis]